MFLPLISQTVRWLENLFTSVTDTLKTYGTLNDKHSIDEIYLSAMEFADNSKHDED
jgi:hypothetical protein